MNESVAILFPIFFPITAGVLLLLGKEPRRKHTLSWYTGSVLVITALSMISLMVQKDVSYTMFSLTDKLLIFFKLDNTGRLFMAVTCLIWVIAGFYSFVYMKHEEHQKRYFGFYLVVFGILAALDLSGNLITFYLFYEFMTLLSMPLVIHTRSKEAIMAALKYLFYSFCGAYMALFGLYFMERYGNTLTFTAGGVLDPTLLPGKETLLLVVAFFMILGFSVKAGMFPMHGWLSAAHPIAPAPASAVLSGIIVKSGVLGIIRVVYYIFGFEFLAGTWVQTVFLILSLVTVFIGSMLAFLEKGLKKRLAFSTVSQVSYILFGLFLFSQEAFTGACLHVVFHALIKSCLFLCAGIIIFKTGKTKVEELKGIGKEMPITMWCYTFCSLALIGIPPFCGFVSKWYLGIGSLNSGLAVFSWLGPVILLVSALLTAGYLLPVTINGFFPGSDFDYEGLEKREPQKRMLVPVIILAALALLLGMVPGELISCLNSMLGQIF